MKQECKHGFEINDGHYLELLDRLHVLNMTLEDYCIGHVVSCKHDDVKEKLEDAAELISEAYQMVGAIDTD